MLYGWRFLFICFLVALCNGDFGDGCFGSRLFSLSFLLVFCSFGLIQKCSCSFGLIQKNQKIKATTTKATNSLREAKISETRFAQTPRFLYASLGICLTLSPLMPFFYCLGFTVLAFAVRYNKSKEVGAWPRRASCFFR